jgi:SAM-dependent methyltransferase
MTEPEGPNPDGKPPTDEEINRNLWTVVNSQHTDSQADRMWRRDGVSWGLFAIPESELGALGDVAGLDVLELGCGTAYFSAWLARLGARPVALDLTGAQLASARRCQAQFDLHFPLIEANAERVPLADDSFDLVVSEYGASLWCDPRRWVAEAARVLRPGGRLVFLTCSVLVTLCVPDESGEAQDRLLRPQRRDLRVQWHDGGVEYHPSHGEWIDVLRGNGFTVEWLRELYAPAGAVPAEYYEIALPDWASRWPVEDLWSARLPG